MEISDKIKKLIDDEFDDLDDSSEKISDSFTCCVCLELLYKPIVLACGHVSCFWCVNKSMNRIRESHCPICRRAYQHFPTICQMLHFILLKLYPVAYKRREIQITEFEKEVDCFSPHFEDPSCKEQIGEGVCDGENSLTVNGACRKISVDDVLCTSCHQLVYRPVVLNCGHVYCQSCCVIQTNDVIKCFECQIAHPERTPKVCLELDNFVEEQFPAEYAARKRSVQLKQPCFEQDSPSTCPSGDVKEKNRVRLLISSGDNPLSWLGDSKIHYSAGCDSCGMFPIVGVRYKCKDCVEQIGFDLCGECYNTGSKLPGRFNQQHTPEHRFEIQKPNMRNIMLRLLRDVPSPPTTNGELPEGLEGRVTTLFDDSAQESPDSGFATSSEMEDDHSNHQEDESM